MLKLCIHHGAMSVKFPQMSDIDRRQRDEDDGVIVHAICENVHNFSDDRDDPMSYEDGFNL